MRPTRPSAMAGGHDSSGRGGGVRRTPRCDLRPDRRGPKGRSRRRSVRRVARVDAIDGDELAPAMVGDPRERRQLAPLARPERPPGAADQKSEPGRSRAPPRRRRRPGLLPRRRPLGRDRGRALPVDEGFEPRRRGVEPADARAPPGPRGRRRPPTRRRRNSTPPPVRRTLSAPPTERSPSSRAATSSASTWGCSRPTIGLRTSSTSTASSSPTFVSINGMSSASGRSMVSSSITRPSPRSRMSMPMTSPPTAADTARHRTERTRAVGQPQPHHERRPLFRLGSRCKRRISARATAVCRWRDLVPKDTVSAVPRRSDSLRCRRSCCSATAQSSWNAANLFTGWVDVDLSPAGRRRGAQRRRAHRRGAGPDDRRRPHLACSPAR